MITIWFEPHGTTVDNEAERASGWSDAPRYPKGLKDAQQLAARTQDRKICMAARLALRTKMSIS